MGSRGRRSGGLPRVQLRRRRWRPAVPGARENPQQDQEGAGPLEEAECTASVRSSPVPVRVYLSPGRRQGSWDPDVTLGCCWALAVPETATLRETAPGAPPPGCSWSRGTGHRNQD